jgi:Fe-S-cluster containining protein
LITASTLNPKYKTQLNKANSNRKENKNFLANLGKKKNVDQLFHPRHEEVFSRVDCLQCANCCKTTSPIFRDTDIERIAKHLRVRPSEFTDKYLHMDEEQDWVLNTAPCAFLEENNYCSIYDVRPKACREYPHTDRKNMAGIMELTFKNTMVCPAVAEIVDSIRLAVKSSYEK